MLAGGFPRSLAPGERLVFVERHLAVVGAHALLGVLVGAIALGGLAPLRGGFAVYPARLADVLSQASLRDAVSTVAGVGVVAAGFTGFLAGRAYPGRRSAAVALGGTGALLGSLTYTFATLGALTALGNLTRMPVDARFLSFVLPSCVPAAALGGGFAALFARD